MRLALNAILVVLIILLMAFAIVPSGAVYPSSFGNAYPQTVWSGVQGSVTGSVVSSHNTSFGISNCYIAIVNASNLGQEYFNTTTDSNGTFSITGINATYSSILGEGPDGTNGSLSAGMGMYEIYVFSGQYGENYSAPFGIDANASGPATTSVYLPGSLAYINFVANPYLDTTGGMYSANLTAYVYDNSGNPAADGTVINFALNVLDWSYLNGSLNGNNSQYASVPTSGGMAVVHYGWFPGNKVPTGYVMVTATLNNTPEVNSTLYVAFKGPSQVITSPTPSPAPTAMPTGVPTNAPVGTPSPTTIPAHAPSATQSPSPTPLSPMIALLSIGACAAILSALRKK